MQQAKTIEDLLQNHATDLNENTAETQAKSYLRHRMNLTGRIWYNMGIYVPVVTTYMEKQQSTPIQYIFPECPRAKSFNHLKYNSGFRLVISNFN